MRNFIKLIVTLCFVIFIALRPVEAQEALNLYPGINCGIAGDIATNKCCYQNEVPITQGPEYGDLFNTIKNAILGTTIEFFRGNFLSPFEEYKQKMAKVCLTGKQSTEDPSDLNCRCELDGEAAIKPLERLTKFCQAQTKPEEVSSCLGCINLGGVWTGLGCVQGTVGGFIRDTVFSLGVGLAGGVSLLCLIYSAFMMQSSQGNPEKLKKAQEMITSCIMGLMLIIFSIFILRLIGVNILRIPGFK